MEEWRHCPRQWIGYCLATLLASTTPVMADTETVIAEADTKANSLKFSGYLDLGVYSLVGGATRVGTIQRNYLGLAGQHGLGDSDWAATFNLQTRFLLPSLKLEPSGATPLFQGEATVGVSSPYGDLRLGRALTPMWTYDWLYDPWENFNRVTSVAWQIFHPEYRTDPYNNGPAGEYARLNNGVFYDSPKWNGLHMHLSAGLYKHRQPDKYGHMDQVYPLGASINYDAAPWSAMLAGERNSARDSTFFAGVSRTIGQVTLMGSYNWVHLDEPSREFFDEPRTRRSAATFGATWRATAKTTLKFSVGRDFQGYNGSGQTNYLSAGVDYNLTTHARIYGGVGYSFADGRGPVHNLGAGAMYWF